MIYFSFGSCIRSADLPGDKLNAFIETFRLMKQKVLWKFENETLPNMPSNVMIKKWLPQNEILAHKNVVLFLGHGGRFLILMNKIELKLIIRIRFIGIFGTQESIYWAVPMVFIPIYSDQFRNAKRCVHAGFAEILSFHDVSIQNLFGKLNMVLHDKGYTNQVRLVSEQFRDNLVSPMDESIFWIEYIARHKKNYPIFKPHAPNVQWYTYLYLDLVFVVSLVFYFIFALTKFMLKKVWQRFDANRNKSKQKLN